MYVYVCMYVCMYVCVCIYMCIYVYIICVYVVYMCVCMCGCVCMYVGVYMYICMCIYIIMYKAKSTLCGRALYKSVIIIIYYYFRPSFCHVCLKHRTLRNTLSPSPMKKKKRWFKADPITSSTKEPTTNVGCRLLGSTKQRTLHSRYHKLCSRPLMYLFVVWGCGTARLTSGLPL